MVVVVVVAVVSDWWWVVLHLEATEGGATAQGGRTDQHSLQLSTASRAL